MFKFPATDNETRVILDEQGGSEAQDYINANYIRVCVFTFPT